MCLAITIALFLLPMASHAQFIRGWGIKGGMMGGFEKFTFAGPGQPASFPTVVRWGAQGGLFVEFINVPHFSFDVELAYVQKGRKVTAQEVAAAAAGQSALSSGPVGDTPRLDYVSLGFLMKGRAGGTGVVPFVILGPTADFLVAKRPAGSPLYNGFKKTDVGASVGLGCEIVPWRAPILSIEGRWSPSFSRVYDNGTLHIKNQTFALLLAVWL